MFVVTVSRVESFFLNPHLIICKILILIGALLIGIVPFNYMRRTGHSITNLFVIANYSKSEWKNLFIGIITLLIGMLGNSVMLKKYGYYVRVIDSNGVERVENSKDW